MSGIISALPVFTKSFESDWLPIVAGGLITLAHGFGKAPKPENIDISFKAVVPGVSGFPEGQIYSNKYHDSQINTTTNENRGAHISADEINIYVRNGNDVVSYVSLRSDAGSFSGVVNVNHNIKITAVA